MSTVPIDTLEPTARPLPEIAVLRHVDILDAEFNVVLSGSSRDSLVEAHGTSLAPDVAAEVAALVRTHNFDTRPIATGLVGKKIALRIVRITGPAGSFYTVFSERTLLERRMTQLILHYALTAPEAELLRLVAGGYPFAEMVVRLAIAPTPLRAQLRALEEKVGCIGRKELAKLALGKGTPPVNSPSLASFPAVNSDIRRARRAAIRHR